MSRKKAGTKCYKKTGVKYSIERVLALDLRNWIIGLFVFKFISTKDRPCPKFVENV